jgi:hypothetical protein
MLFLRVTFWLVTLGSAGTERRVQGLGCASLDAGTRALGLDRDLREGVLFL